MKASGHAKLILWFKSFKHNFLKKTPIMESRTYTQTKVSDEVWWLWLWFVVVVVVFFFLVDCDVLTFYRVHKAVNGHHDFHLHYPKGVGIWSFGVCIFFWFFVCMCLCVCINVMWSVTNGTAIDFIPQIVFVWCAGFM